MPRLAYLSDSQRSRFEKGPQRYPSAISQQHAVRSCILYLSMAFNGANLHYINLYYTPLRCESGWCIYMRRRLLQQTAPGHHGPRDMTKCYDITGYQKGVYIQHLGVYVQRHGGVESTGGGCENIRSLLQ